MMMPSLFTENLFDDFFNDFDEDFFGKKNPLYGKHARNMMKTDVRETDTTYEVDVDLPGFKKEDINVNYENGYLTISTSKGLDKDEKDKEGHYIRQERYVGNMTRSFYLGDIPKEDIDEFIIAMQEIKHIPFENLMQIMCFLNYILNNEKCSLEDIFIDDSLQEHFAKKTSRHGTDHSLSDKLSEQDIIFHSTYDLEENFMNMIRKGDYISISNLLENSPIFKKDVMESNHLRFFKNSFVAIATLASRAAIQGGMNPDDAFTLIDNYILMCELLDDCNRINNLGRLMVMDFAKRVNQLYKGTQASHLILDVSNYINRHMSEAITVEAMSKDFFMSRSYLSKRFKAESNVTLTDFILTKKTDEAKHLLRYTKQSLTAISLHLGFSSPGHFSRVFRKYASVSPKEYREKYTN